MNPIKERLFGGYFRYVSSRKDILQVPKSELAQQKVFHATLKTEQFLARPYQPIPRRYVGLLAI